MGQSEVFGSAQGSNSCRQAGAELRQAGQDGSLRELLQALHGYKRRCRARRACLLQRLAAARQLGCEAEQADVGEARSCGLCQYRLYRRAVQAQQYRHAAL